jgi:outer membrane protein assembly factor BamE (lipoprotein component of BamABCDE complex)
MSACTAQYVNHGYIPPAEDLDQIVVGVDTRSSVEEIIGTPSTAGVVNDSGFYYVRSRRRTIGALAPKVIERQVLAISFDTAGVVTNVERFGLERGQVVPLARRVTTSGVGNSGFLRQLLGNLGRFNPAALAG